MEAVFGLLVILLGVSHGVETQCDGRQDGAQCYGALGGTVVLQLMDSTSEVFRYLWKKTETIFHGRNDKILHNTMKDRSIFIPSNGTFRINNLIRTDGGEYTLQIFDSNGQESEQRTLQLSIQGFIFINCTLPDGTNISQWSFSANNTLCLDPTATPPMITHTKPSTTITPYNQTVTNSSRDDPLYISNSLPEFGLRAAVVLSLFGGIAIYFAWKKKKYMKVETSSIPQVKDHPENSFEMVEL